MKSLLVIVLITLMMSLTDAGSARAEPVTYAAISERAGHPILDQQQLEHARDEGECLAGIYRLNAFQGDYDPIHEWLRVRTSHLLQRHSPCELLVMLEVAKSRMQKLRSEGARHSPTEP